MESSVKLFIAAIGTILMTAVSCNKEFTETTDSNLEKHTCEMKLVGSLVNFDGPETRADANATTWADGSVIYLRMASPLGTTTGEAVYSSSKDVWTISYYGSLYEGMSNTCSALYVEDKVSYDNSVFTFNEGSIIYEDVDGTYIYDGGDLIVIANLQPKTGRIRFSGTPGSVLKIYGVTHYVTYDINNHQYTSSSDPFKISVNEDGYTPYFYGHFTNCDEPNIKVWIDAKEAYTRYFSNNVFNAGQSGILTIPTIDSHTGWADGLYFSLDDVKFKLIAVEGGKFTMGDPASTSEYYIAHNVTLTGFCIAETEMTKQLYYKSTSTYSTDLTPYLIDWSYVTDAIKRFNQFTYAGFNLPSEAQWEYAAKGGRKSQNYIYSGSDSIDDVAWYSVNSGDKLHEVKKKLPNELGLYDMSGNAREYVLDYYNPFTNKSLTDPVSTDKSKNHVIRGGYYKSEASSCTTIYRIGNVYYDYSTYYDYHDCNIRLTLNWN